MQIDVENPCVIMSQDKSREFLHSGNAKDKFKVRGLIANIIRWCLCNLIFHLVAFFLPCLYFILSLEVGQHCSLNFVFFCFMFLVYQWLLLNGGRSYLVINLPLSWYFAVLFQGNTTSASGRSSDWYSGSIEKRKWTSCWTGEINKSYSERTWWVASKD